ncbi:MAG: hypothetical protein WC699_14785 [Bacteroidales bacterium]|jgi:hypothetical protein
MKSLKLIGAFILILAMGGPSCQKFNLNTDDLDIKLDMNIVKTVLIVQFRDANTSSLIGANDNSRINVSIIGDDSQWVVNNSGFHLSDTHSAGGYLTFGLDPYKAKPSEADPVRLTLLAELSGYVSTSVPVVITGEGQQYISVFMINQVSPPAGVTISANKNAGNSSDGKVSQNFKVATTNKSLEVTVPVGISIRDATGNPLQGKLDLTFVQADPTKLGAGRSFPGGHKVEATSESGSKDKGSFAPAGFFKIDIADEYGKHGASFSEGTLEIKAKIDPSVINPETGQPVKTGDKVGLWNLEEKTGQWNFVKNIFVGQDPLELKADLSSGSFISGGGSWFNFGWLLQNCTALLQFSFSSPNGLIGVTQQAEFDIEVISQSGSWEYSGHINIFGTLPVVIGSFAPGNHVITFYYNGDRQLTNSPWLAPNLVTRNFCLYSDGEIIPLVQNTAILGHDITFNAEIFCTDRNAALTVPSGTLLHFREKGTTEWITVTTNGSQVILPGLILNKTYEVQVLNDASWTPVPPYEYTLGQPDDPANPYVRNLSFSIDCGG